MKNAKEIKDLWTANNISLEIPNIDLFDLK